MKIAMICEIDRIEAYPHFLVSLFGCFSKPISEEREEEAPE